MQKIVFDFITKEQMLERGDRIVVGVSGGADSVCLLRLLCEVREAYGLDLYAVHVNHGLRGEEAERDERFVTELCKQSEVPCRVERLDIRERAKELHLSEEETGRDERYRIFADEAGRRACNKIAVAHHMDDNAETLLFRMFRGTGISGLSGMLPVNELDLKKVSKLRESEQGRALLTVIRPLLCVTRTEIEEYLAGCGQMYCTDSTNKDCMYSRNRIRNEILPVASEYINAQSVRNLNSLAQQARRTAEYLERQATELYRQCVSCENGSLVVKLQGEEEPVLLELVLRRCMYQLAGKKRDISAVHIESLYELCKKQVGSRLDLPYGITAKRIYTGIRMSSDRAERADETTAKPYTVRAEDGILREMSVELPGKYGRLKFSVKDAEAFGTEGFGEIIKIAQNDYTKCFDYDKIKGNISVRVPQTADYLCIHPDGRRKLLKDYLVDVKIPQEDRNALYLVAEDDLVLWIPGKRTSENRRVSDKTKRVLLIEWIL